MQNNRNKVLYERGFYIMEQSQDKELLDNIDKRGTEFLNDIINMRGDIEKISRDFTKDLLQMDGDNKYAINKINEYYSVADMLRYTFGLYRSNIDYFETQVLQLNSVISTSLTIEYRIHDILFNKNLLLKTNEFSDVEKMQNIIDTIKEKQKEIKDDKLTLPLQKEAMTQRKQMQDKAISCFDYLIKAFTPYLEDAQKQAEGNNNRIQEFKKDAYYIATLSKDDNLISLFNSVILNYVANDIIEGVRETFFKKYKVIIENRTAKAERVHCLRVGALRITQNKFAEILKLSLLNEGGNVLDKKALNLINIFIDIKEQTKTKEYITLLKKYTKIASKEIEAEKRRKADLLARCTLHTAKELLQEMRWCDFEE